MDPLSDILALLRPKSYVSAGLDLGGDWSIAFARYQGIKCNVVLAGTAWLVVEGVDEPVHLKAGDCVILPSGRPFRLASDLALPPVPAETYFPMPGQGGTLQINGGGDFFIAGSRFALSGEHASILLEMLPPIVRIGPESEQAALRWFVDRMMHEMREGQPGGHLVAQHLAHLMLVQALRLWLAEAGGRSVGWLFALADPKMSAAISAIHADPAHAWTVAELAEVADLSRSTFALRFRTTVGSTPLEYLTRWRMLLAADRLADSGDTIGTVARSLGYESESAFGTAFKRVMGRSPRRYARDRSATAVA